MAAEAPPPPSPDGLISTTPPTGACAADLNPSDHHPPTSDDPIASKVPDDPPKRQRRPSVRLGEIGGEPPLDFHRRRHSKTYRFHKDPSLAAKTSKTRPLTNLVNGGDLNLQDFPGPKINKPTKRVRTNWHKFDSNGVGGREGAIMESSNAENLGNDNNNDNDEEESRDFEVKGSKSPLLKEQSHGNSEENMGLHYWDHQRRGSGVRASESNGVLHEEINSPQTRHDEGNLGVREWLTSLGLGRYAPVFEIHEVDDEVLPMLTLEDLKDMGINAVGSRRKMYSAILKLRK